MHARRWPCIGWGGYRGAPTRRCGWATSTTAARFRSPHAEELREKLGYWLDPAREDRRRAMARAARERCLSEDYSYRPVVRRFLSHFQLPDTSGAHLS